MPQLKGRIVLPETDCRGYQQSARDANKNFTITYHGIVATCIFMGLDESGYHTYMASILNPVTGISINMPEPRRTIETQHWCWRVLAEVNGEKQKLSEIQEGTCLPSSSAGPAR